MSDQYNSKKKEPSLYKPSDEEKAKLQDIMESYEYGTRLMNTPLRAFDNRTILEEIDINQKRFNTYIPPKDADPDTEWQAQTVRPIARNKIVAIAASVLTKVIYPSFSAINEMDKEDKAASEVMDMISRWLILNSDYELEYVRAGMNILTDPVAYLTQEYSLKMRKVKERLADGTISTYEVIDEVMSGLQFAAVPAEEILIADIKQQNIQKQPWVIHQKNTTYASAKLLYGDRDNFVHVKPGKFAEFDPQKSMFYYDTYQELGNDEVKVITYYNRTNFEKIIVINGIMISPHDEPMDRMDGLYPFAKAVYEEIKGLYFGKSAVNKLAPDQKLADSVYNMIFDSVYKELWSPMLIFGSEAPDSSVMIPGTQTHFSDPETRVEQLNGNSDIRSGLIVAQNIENSMSESSAPSRSLGVADRKEMTAVEFAGLQENAVKALGLFGTQLLNFVLQTGRLMMGDIKQHYTIGDIEKILGKEQGNAYKTFLVDMNFATGDDSDMRQVRLTDEFIGEGEVDEFSTSMNILQEEGLDSNMKIYLVNPPIFRNMKFNTYVNPDELIRKNKRLEKAMRLEAYDRAINNPVVNLEELTKDFLFENFVPGQGGKYVKKPQQEPPQPPQGATGSSPQMGASTGLVPQMTGGQSLSSLMSKE